MNKAYLRRVAAPTAALALSLGAVMFSAPASAAADKDCNPQSFASWEEAQIYFENNGGLDGMNPGDLDGSPQDYVVCENEFADSPGRTGVAYTPGTLTGRASTSNINQTTGTQGELPSAGGPEVAGGLAGLALAGVGGALLVRNRRRALL